MSEQHRRGGGGGPAGEGEWSSQQYTLRSDPYHQDYAARPQYGGAGHFQGVDGSEPSKQQQQQHVQITDQLPNPRSNQYPPPSASEQQQQYQPRPNPATYKSNTSADWARLLGRAGYQAAPINDEHQQYRGRGPANSPLRSMLPNSIFRLFRKSAFIFIIAAVLWIPGIVALTAYSAGPHNNYSRPRVWKVGIFWWSCWLSSIWVGWWVSIFVFKAIPRLLGGTVGVFLIETKHYIQYLMVLSRYIALFAWTFLVCCSTFRTSLARANAKRNDLIPGLDIMAGRDPAKSGDVPVTSSNSSSASGLTGLDPNSLFNSTSIIGQDSLTSTYNLMLTLTHLWFGLVISAALLLAEKFLIQVIALSFHRVSYEDRLAQNKLHVEILTTLYDHAIKSGAISSAASSRPGTPPLLFSGKGSKAASSAGGNGTAHSKRSSFFDYERLHFRHRSGARSRRGGGGGSAGMSQLDPSSISLTPTTSTTSSDLAADDAPVNNNNSIMGFAAAEMGAESDWAAAQHLRAMRLRFKNGVPLPAKVSPRTAVIVALSSAGETRKLCLKIFRALSHLPSSPTLTGEEDRVLEFADIARAFAGHHGDKTGHNGNTAAKVAWEMLDRDFNGDVNEDEMLAAGQEIHREREALMSSMRDIDSAVGRLDQVFMSFFGIISVTIVAGLISVKFSSLVTSFGTVLLGLSWLLSSTAQEALSAIIFLFVKHPYDVGDRVIINPQGSGDVTYVVAEIQLLSTIFKTTTGMYVQISHSVLTTRVVNNLRRSGPIEETITIDVPYSTTFVQIEQLRELMIDWVADQPRDFFPGLNIAVLDLPEFKTITLQTGIRYKSNWQAGGLKTARKNRWMCRFKEALSETGIALPDPPSTTRITMIPYPMPESETAKPTPAEALAGTRGVDPSDEADGNNASSTQAGAPSRTREVFNFLDSTDGQDAKLLNLRSVRQRGQEGGGVDMRSGYSSSLGQGAVGQASVDMRRRGFNGGSAGASGRGQTGYGGDDAA
ncbi:hypothetical protein OC846_005308 [Tilletia horrida]|uniref:EF-hand domain-containing protein n=1 Tax=Tilletia horrida TaxID=155126 RepID=A0AAN6JQC7_9BASI|nr:hypothetical protein OC845_005504 [Tilletia horrida]KAK0546335.1 hypothetical protein OC846_005308 [Tilletia horrida]KAK0561857.1 hypothetical protein OC861_005609 [Tilletia horrida]